MLARINDRLAGQLSGPPLKDDCSRRPHGATLRLAGQLSGPPLKVELPFMPPAPRDGVWPGNCPALH